MARRLVVMLLPADHADKLSSWAQARHVSRNAFIRQMFRERIATIEAAKQ